MRLNPRRRQGKLDRVVSKFNSSTAIAGICDENDIANAFIIAVITNVAIRVSRFLMWRKPSVISARTRFFSVLGFWEGGLRNT